MPKPSLLIVCFAFVLVAVSEDAWSLSYGTGTLIIYQHTGGAPANLAGGADLVLPNQGFAVPDSGAGSFGGSAHASALELGSSAFVQAVGSHVCQCVGVGALVNAKAITQESFEVSGLVGLAGFLAYDLEVAGSAVGSATGNGAFTLGPVGLVTVEAANGIANNFSVFGFGGSTYTPPPTTFASAVPVTTPLRIEVPFVAGMPITVRLTLTSLVEGGATAGSVNGISDYGSTLRIRALSVLDASHQPMAGATVAALSGTLYPVPEPTATLLLASAVAVIAARRPRRLRSLHAEIPRRVVTSGLIGP